MKPRLYVHKKRNRLWVNFLLNCNIPIGNQLIDKHLKTHYNAVFVTTANWDECHVEFESQSDLDFFTLKWTDYV